MKTEYSLSCCYDFFLLNDLRHIGFHFPSTHGAAIKPAILCACIQGGVLVLAARFAIHLGADLESLG